MHCVPEKPGRAKMERSRANSRHSARRTCRMTRELSSGPLGFMCPIEDRRLLLFLSTKAVFNTHHFLVFRVVGALAVQYLSSLYGGHCWLPRARAPCNGKLLLQNTF